MTDVDAPRVQLTREAAEFVKERIAAENLPNAALRLGVKGGGCNGLIYVFDYTSDPPRERDIVYEFFGTKVYVDNRSIEFIEGSTVYLEDTLMFRGLRFKNPLETATCGCGETFSVDREAMKTSKARALPTTGS